MRTLGLTGGIGSGKTAAARIFEELGAEVIAADDEAKRLMQEDLQLRQALIQEFGPETYRPDGTLDRHFLADRVFGDREALARLNALVHPRVREAYPEIRRRAEATGAALLVYEAALLVEAGSADRFDALAVVDAPRETRIQRVMERDGASREAVEARLKHQLPGQELLLHADFVIDNRGDRDYLRQQVKVVFNTMTD